MSVCIEIFYWVLGLVECKCKIVRPQPRGVLGEGARDAWDGSPFLENSLNSNPFHNPGAARKMPPPFCPTPNFDFRHIGFQ